MQDKQKTPTSRETVEIARAVKALVGRQINIIGVGGESVVVEFYVGGGKWTKFATCWEQYQEASSIERIIEIVDAVRSQLRG